MPSQRIPMRKVIEILRLKYEAELSHEKIACAVGLSKGAVAKYVALAKALEITWPLPPGMDETQSSLRNELELVTEAELCRHLKVCRRQLYAWRMAGLIPYFKIGKAVRFRMTDVLEALEQMRIG